MRRMVKVTLLVAAAAAATSLGALFLVPVAQAKDIPEIIVLKACQKRRSPVTFQHKKHHARVAKLGKDCTTCHHNGDPKKGPADGKTCSSCHKKAAGSSGGTCFDMGKKNPFHLRCLGCHKENKGKHGWKPPTTCKGCHA